MHKTLARQLFTCLRQMDAEAVPLTDGTPTGLHGYKGFVDGSFKATPGTPWENCWSDRISQLLAISGKRVRRECRYVNGTGRQRCDLVIERGRNAPAWIEVKGSWRVLVNDDNTPGPANRAFTKHLLRAADDVVKLLAIPATEASHVGLLVVGFDTSDRPITDVDLRVIRDRAVGWHESRDRWDDRAYPGFRIGCWFWSSDVR